MSASTDLHLKLYVQGCLTVLFALIMVGFIVPCLLSADDDFFPAIGVLLLLAVPPGVWIVARHIYVELKGDTNEKTSSTRPSRSTRSY